MIRACPVCRIGLVDKKLAGVGFAECPQCAAIWITSEELKRLEAQGAGELKRLDAMENPMSVPHPPAASVLACPSCGRAMEQFRFLYNTPILLHRCQPCEALWIEDGELAQMATVIEQSGGVQPPTGIDRAKAEAIIAEFTVEHEREMARYRSIGSVCGVLAARARPWGLWA